ncbi:unnamed protein product [Medioppia subpectinata]|uniref:1,4-alpha-glucan branching enzyme n=1 Tax=Medioppia subpectinata TaxID=1979941 RepID=A0A7R9KC91_9ACAR|nr:unnamed protein product [Medioppia subpectinata]CAG2100429.1 unnamed protein product [Medioppia subpectinata]
MEPICDRIETLLQSDGYLRLHENEIRRRFRELTRIVAEIETSEGLDAFTRSYEKYGIHVNADHSVTCLQWCPNARALYLRGDFNQWQMKTHAFERLEHGKWKLEIAAVDGAPAIAHLSKVKLVVETPSGELLDRLDPWATYVVQPPRDSGNTLFDHVFWNPAQKHVFKHAKPAAPRNLRIYESHVGIASADYKVATYREFADNIVPRIARQGYNAIQLMAIQEHAYYASFGYQVTSFFAASSRYGSPEDLKYLIDRAHALGLYTLLDIVHSHASKNVLDGLNEFDGTNGGYFHSSSRGFHSQWDSRLFDFTQWETKRFLLSNLRFYLNEYQFDGFRFDGVTSLLYHSHGITDGFSGDYNEYFGLNTDTESFNYLQLANHVIHRFHPNATTIAEDVSGMPALCRPVEEGGGGFDLRLGMAIPDLWIKMLKHQRDEDWDLELIVHTLTNRRWQERTVAYAESHDQALVGDKTLAFWLMDKEMYDFMSRVSPLTPIIDRGLALHKMIRLLTHALGKCGEAWLNFMGNEFGHPEWLDFPRVGNQESYHHARRQWHLVDDSQLRYSLLNAFDAEMNFCEQKLQWLSSSGGWVSTKHQEDKVVVFERNGALFVFNFHHEKSFPDYRVGCHDSGVYQVALNSDEQRFGGHDRVSMETRFHTSGQEFNGRRDSLLVYIPSRVALVLARVQ